ncbi:MAG: sigma-E factor negative regulatory protein [Aeromonadaceae bacterium]
MANNERISALMDSEADEASWLQAAVRESEDQATWSRYHMIGDALRNELPAQLDFDLTARIAQALQDEPTVLAPKPSSLSLATLRPQVISLLRTAGQFAIAASVAAVTILGVQHYQAGSNPELAPSPVLNTIPFGGVAAPVSVNYQSNRPSLVHAPQPAMSEAQMQSERERIAAFLRDHQLQQRLHQAEQ